MHVHFIQCSRYLEKHHTHAKGGERDHPFIVARVYIPYKKNEKQKNIRI